MRVKAVSGAAGGSRLTSPPGSGWSRVAINSPFTRVLGAVYERTHQDVRTFAVRIAPRHLNVSGFAHGGFLMTVADVALSWGHDAGRHVPRITVSLNCDFIGTARRGDWLEVDVAIKRLGRTLVFVNGDMRVGTKPVAHASGVLRVQPASSPSDP